MGKLGKEKKEALVDEILNRKFSDQINKLESGCLEKVTSVIEEEQKGIPFKACTGYITYTSSAYVHRKSSYGNQRESGRFDLRLNPSRPTKSAGFHFYAEDNDWAEKFIKEKEKINDEKKSVRETIMAVLNSCNTEKQLFETLPEMEPIFKDLFCKREEVSVVAVETVDKARAILGGV